MDVGLEMLPWGFSKMIQRDPTSTGGGPSGGEVLARLRESVTGWPSRGYESLLSDSRLDGVAFHGFGFYPGRSKPTYGDRIRLLAEEVCRSGSSKRRKLVILVGSWHLGPPDDCLGVLREAGYSVALVAPLCEEWESTLQHQAGTREGLGWLRLGEHVYRSPWLTNVRVVGHASTFDTPTGQRPCPEEVLSRLIREGSRADTHVGLYVEDAVSRLRGMIDERARSMYAHSRSGALTALTRLAEQWSVARSALLDVALSDNELAASAAGRFVVCEWNEDASARIRQALHEDRIRPRTRAYLASYLGWYLDREPAVCETLANELRSKTMGVEFGRDAAIALANYGRRCSRIRGQLEQAVSDPDPVIARAVRLALDRTANGP